MVELNAEPVGFCRSTALKLRENMGMDINRFTEKLQEAIRSAQSKAIRYGHQQVDVEHVLAALLEQEGGLASSILNKAGVQSHMVQRRI